MQKQGSAIGAILLITGSCIGSGMLGLPVVSAAAGFIPSTLAMALAYLFACSTGLLLVEAALWFDGKVHMISLCKETLGNEGKWVAWSFFCFLFYCLFVAYIEGGGQLFTSLISFLFKGSFSREVGIFICVLVVSCIVYTGTRFVSYISRVFLVGLAISYGFLVVLGLPQVEGQQLLHKNWTAAAATIPILFICFGYQNLVPTVIYFVKKNVKMIRQAILIGNFIPFCVYLLWNFLILGILPDIDVSKVVAEGDMVTGLLKKASESSSVIFFANAFSFFAIVTPFAVSTIAFLDFLKDGLKKIPFFQNDALLFGFVLIPPTIFTLVYPNLFLSALGFAGGFVDAVLFGILPVMIVWVGRYRKGLQGPYTVGGGKGTLSLVLLFSIGVILYRLTKMFN